MMAVSYRVVALTKSIRSENSFEVFERMEDEGQVLAGNSEQVGPVVAAGGQHDVLRQVAELLATAENFTATRSTRAFTNLEVMGSNLSLRKLLKLRS